MGKRCRVAGEEFTALPVVAARGGCGGGGPFDAALLWVLSAMTL